MEVDRKGRQWLVNVSILKSYNTVIFRYSSVYTEVCRTPRGDNEKMNSQFILSTYTLFDQQGQYTRVCSWHVIGRGKRCVKAAWRNWDWSEFLRPQVEASGGGCGWWGWYGKPEQRGVSWDPQVGWKWWEGHAAVRGRIWVTCGATRIRDSRRLATPSWNSRCEWFLTWYNMMVTFYQGEVPPPVGASDESDSANHLFRDVTDESGGV